MTATTTPTRPLGHRVLNHTVETTTTWRIDTEDVIPALPHMRMRLRGSSIWTTGPVIEILVQELSTGRGRPQVTVMLINVDPDRASTEDSPFVTFGSGASWRPSYRISALPQVFKDLVNAQTGLTL